MIRIRDSLLVLVSSGLLSASVRAQDVDSVLSPIGKLTESVIPLLIVIGCFLLVAVLFRRVTGIRPESGAIRLLGGISVGHKQRVVLLEVQGLRVLVGVSPGRVETIHAFGATGMIQQSTLGKDVSEEEKE